MCKELLIYGSYGDVHCQAIEWALQAVEIHPTFLVGSEFPEFEKHTLKIDSRTFDYKIYKHAQHIDPKEYTNVWFRRLHRPMISSSLKTSDQLHATREAQKFVYGTRSFLSKYSRWINKPDAEAVASRKPFQLAIASKCGLQIPKTIISNNITEIEKFFKECDGNVVFKTLTPATWVTTDGSKILYVQKIGFEDIKNRQLINNVPHMFQKYIEKDSELRIIYMNGLIRAYSLDSQQNENTKIDWRAEGGAELNPSVVTLSQYDNSKIKHLMGTLGLIFGVIDAIIDENGRLIFLEVNSNGQFLFLEKWNPQLNVLSDFVLFVTDNLCLSESEIQKLRDTKFCNFLEDTEFRTQRDELAKQQIRPEKGHFVYDERSEQDTA